MTGNEDLKGAVQFVGQHGSLTPSMRADVDRCLSGRDSIPPMPPRVANAFLNVDGL
jgi:hypothetical protein